MSVPNLYTFAISHYCELARFALDYHQINFKLRPLAPGWHVNKLKKLAAPTSEVPLLTIDNSIFQGSIKILDWAEENSNNREYLKAAKSGNNGDCKIETRVVESLGVEIRRLFYAEALLDCPEIIPPIFQAELSFIHQIIFKLSWKKIKPLMIKYMKIDSHTREQARAIVSEELDWLDSLLPGAGCYFVNGSFSRTDLVVASLLSPLVTPPQHPTYDALKFPPKLSRDIKHWCHRPCWRAVSNIYKFAR